MKQLFIRGGRPDDTVEILKWLKENKQGRFDSAILNYPTLQVLTSYKENGPTVCHLPLQRVLMMETIARNPQASSLDVAQSLRDLTKGAQLVADAQGIKEVYFLGGDGLVGEMAVAHGFSKLDMDVFRMKLK